MNAKRKQGPFVDVIEIDGLGTINTDKAIALAVILVHLADGNMVRRADNGGEGGAHRVVAWNDESHFLKAYRLFMQDKLFG